MMCATCDEVLSRTKVKLAVAAPCEIAGQNAYHKVSKQITICCDVFPSIGLRDVENEHLETRY